MGAAWMLKVAVEHAQAHGTSSFCVVWPTTARAMALSTGLAEASEMRVGRESPSRRCASRLEKIISPLLASAMATPRGIWLSTVAMNERCASSSLRACTCAVTSTPKHSTPVTLPSASRRGSTDRSKYRSSFPASRSMGTRNSRAVKRLTGRVDAVPKGRVAVRFDLRIRLPQRHPKRIAAAPQGQVRGITELHYVLGAFVENQRRRQRGEQFLQAPVLRAEVFARALLRIVEASPHQRLRALAPHRQEELPVFRIQPPGCGETESQAANGRLPGKQRNGGQGGPVVERLGEDGFCGANRLADDRSQRKARVARGVFHREPGHPCRYKFLPVVEERQHGAFRAHSLEDALDDGVQHLLGGDRRR